MFDVDKIAEKVANELWGYFPPKSIGEDSEVLLEKIHQECLKEGMTPEEARRETSKRFWEEDIDELENWIVGETEEGHMPLVKKKKRQTKDEFYMSDSEEEFQADLDAQDMRYFQYCREQEEMYNDPVMNWSGLR